MSKKQILLDWSTFLHFGEVEPRFTGLVKWLDTLDKNDEFDSRLLHGAPESCWTCRWMSNTGGMESRARARMIRRRLQRGVFKEWIPPYFRDTEWLPEQTRVVLKGITRLYLTELWYV